MPDAPHHHRQPVHTLYGGAHLFRSDTIPRMGLLAARQFLEAAEDCFILAEALRLPESESLPRTASGRMSLLRRCSKRGKAAQSVHPAGWFTFELHRRVLSKLREQAVEDYRIDFEDGYGVRTASEEDADAARCAGETADALADGTLPPFFGIRIRPLRARTGERALRTLDLYLRGLVKRSSGDLPRGFVVTLPKVSSPEEVARLCDHLTALETELSVPSGRIAVELMVEEPQVLQSSATGPVLRSIVRAGGGRVRGLHLGLYDFLSSLGIAASMQEFRHPSADHLRTVVSTAAAADGVWVSDGAVNTIPVGPHRGARIGVRQRKENMQAVHLGWKEVFDCVTHSLRFGYYQGWDLHPSQLVPRYAAVFALFIREYDASVARLTSFIRDAAKARREGQAFDDIATVRGLLLFFARGYACGAFTEEDLASAGLSIGTAMAGDIDAILSGPNRGQT